MSDQYHHGDLKNALIHAGIEILSKDGLESLSLRSVAKRVGVSHAAPYAHFADKEALIAAIAAAGYSKLYSQLATAQQRSADPLTRLWHTAFAYLQFALDEPDHFRITFSGVVKAEKSYPEYVAQAQRCYALVMGLVADCQMKGLFTGEPLELLTVSIWSSLHGFAQLVLANQLPSALLNQHSIHTIFRIHLQRILQVDPDQLDG